MTEVALNSQSWVLFDPISYKSKKKTLRACVFSCKLFSSHVGHVGRVVDLQNQPISVGKSTHVNESTAPSVQSLRFLVWIVLSYFCRFSSNHFCLVTLNR